MIKKEPTVLVAAILLIVGATTLTPCPSACTCRLKTTTCRNVALTSIPSDINKDTRNLSVSFNSISTLHNTDLTGLLELTIISINDNVIDTIEPEIFHPLKKLRRIYLNNNYITILHNRTFRGLKALSYLFLQNNRIYYMDPLLFKHVTKLKVLDISRNYLRTLAPNIFQSNHVLSWVNIRNNIHINVTYWQPILKHSFNFSDIQSCEEKKYVLNTYKGAYKRKRCNGGSQHIRNHLNKCNEILVRDKDLITKYLFMKPKNASFEKYDTFITTIGYDEYSTVIDGGNFYTLFLTDYPIFCYCTGQFLWFWCQEIEAKCSNNTSVVQMITAVKCSSQVSSKLLPPISAMPNSTISRNSKDFGNVNRKEGSNTNRVNPIKYSWIGAGILIIMVI